MLTKSLLYNTLLDMHELNMHDWGMDDVVVVGTKEVGYAQDDMLVVLCKLLNHRTHVFVLA